MSEVTRYIDWGDCSSVLDVTVNNTGLATFSFHDLGTGPYNVTIIDANNSSLSVTSNNASNGTVLTIQLPSEGIYNFNVTANISFRWGNETTHFISSGSVTVNYNSATLTATPSDSYVLLAWSNFTTDSFYLCWSETETTSYMDLISLGQYSLLSTSSNGWTDFNPPSAGTTRYYYAVDQYEYSLIASCSASTSTSTPTTLSTPSDLTVIPGNGSVTVLFSVVPNATSYEIKYASGYGENESIPGDGVAIISGGTITNLSNGTEYAFLIRAKGNGTTFTDSEWSDRVTATPSTAPTDTTAPVITLTGNATININVGETWTDPGATATDETDATVSVSTSGTVDTTTPGTYTITYSATDTAGNTATPVTRTVIVSEAPDTNYFLISGGDKLHATANTPAGWYKIKVRSTNQFGDYIERYKYVLIEDDTASEDIILSNQKTHISSSESNVGTLSTVDNDEGDIFTYTIQSEETCTQDNTAPIITLNGNSTVYVALNSAWTDPGATATDNNDDNVTNNIVVTGAVNTTTPGTYTLTYSVTDFAGNSATAVTRTIIVNNIGAQDTEAPVLTLFGSSVISIAKDSTWSDPGATATDNNDGDLTNSITKVDTVNTATVGTYSVTYNVTDAAGNTATPVTRTVIVSETPASVGFPLIYLTGAAHVYTKTGETWTDPGATATDSTAEENLTSSITTSGTVDTTTPGTYTVIYSVTDETKTTTINRIVTVVTPPAFSATAISNSEIKISLPYIQTWTYYVRRRINGTSDNWTTIVDGESLEYYIDDINNENGPAINTVYEYQVSTDSTTWSNSVTACVNDIQHYSCIVCVFGNTNPDNVNILRVGDSGVFYARVFNTLTGKNLTPDKVSSIKYTARKLSVSLRSTSWTAITNHTNVDVDNNVSLLPNCIKTSIWNIDETGFNFVHTPNTTEHDIFSTEGTYRIQYRINLLNGNPVNLVFDIIVR